MNCKQSKGRQLHVWLLFRWWSSSWCSFYCVLSHLFSFHCSALVWRSTPTVTPPPQSSAIFMEEGNWNTSIRTTVKIFVRAKILWQYPHLGPVSSFSTCILVWVWVGSECLCLCVCVCVCVCMRVCMHACGHIQNMKLMGLAVDVADCVMFVCSNRFLLGVWCLYAALGYCWVCDVCMQH